MGDEKSAMDHEGIEGFETPIGEEDSQLGDFIEDEGAVSPLEAAESAMLHDCIDDALSTLADRDRRVIELRFGLVDGCPRTLDEVGRELGVTRERVRQIEGKALARLRYLSPGRSLAGYACLD